MFDSDGIVRMNIVHKCLWWSVDGTHLEREKKKKFYYYALSVNKKIFQMQAILTMLVY